MVCSAGTGRVGRKASAIRCRGSVSRRRRREEQLRSGVVQGREADLVEGDEVGAQDGVDDAAHGVVGQAAVEGFDELGGGEVAAPCVRRGWPRCPGPPSDGFAGAGGPDLAEVLLGPDPLQRLEIVERRLGIEDAAGLKSSRMTRCSPGDHTAGRRPR